MEKRLETIGSLLADLLQPEEIIYRNDAPIRRLEGLPLEVKTRSGRPWAPRWFSLQGIEYWLDLSGSQKTGFYLDQSEQHPLIGSFAAGRRVLDAFCNQGPFALHAAKAGAAHVLGLDSSEEAIALARENARRNSLAAEFSVANVFDYFTANRGENWDLIILDPPPFARSKRSLENALRGYKELNLRALQSLAPGGLLATYACSHHVQEAEFRSVLSEAAADARRHVQILHFAHPPADHAPLMTMPESEYLRGYLLRVE